MATKKTEEENTCPEQSGEKVTELIDLLQRTQANFENYRKQTEKRVEEIQQLAAKDLILQLLPIIDNFELALKNVDQSIPSEFVQGIELIYSQLFQILEERGIKLILTTNQQFNPYLHEALMKVPSEFPENTILEEFQKGFTLNGTVIRHAKVKISAGKNNNQGGN